MDGVQKYPDGSCTYQDRNKNWMKLSYPLKYKLYWKSIETEAVFT